MFQLKRAITDAMWDDKKYLLGRVLTIVEASISDPMQRKAMKDIIHDAFYGHGGRRWIVLEAMKQFQDKFVKEDYKFKTEDEQKEFMENTVRTTPDGESFAEDFFPTS